MSRYYPDSVRFCVKYLQERGFLGEVNEIAKTLGDFNKEFILAEVKSDFFLELANALRELWPQGEKDGKYPWRCNPSELSKRLAFVWEDRKLGHYTIDQCTAVARKYLAQYEHNAKYMQILKYFVFKQQRLINHDGKISVINKSVFADMLEGNEFQEEWGVLETQGELV